MSNYMKFCKKCALSYSVGTICRACGDRLFESSVDKVTWDNLSEKDKQNFFVNICGKEGKNGDDLTRKEVQALADQDSIEKNNIRCERIAQEESEERRHSGDRGNSIGGLIKTLAVVLLALSAIGSVMIMASISISVGLVSLLVCCMFSFLCMGIGEICIILSDINRKIR